MYKKCKVKITDIDKEVFAKFDYSFNGVSNFKHDFVFAKPKNFNIGVIYGSSGSGKTTLLSKFGTETKIEWNNKKSVLSHFENSEKAIEKLNAVGFNSVPSWGKPRYVLSTGEGFRVDMARRLENNTVIDEYTSVINRETAKSCSLSLSKYIRKNDIKNFVVATCHDDILDWLKPDWIYNTDLKTMERGSLRQTPKFVVEILPCTHQIWSLFSRHHYLTSKLNKATRNWVAIWENKPVGFISAIYHPQPYHKEDCWREHRIVILPDYQGMGLGSKLSETIGEIFIKNKCRYYTKTAHPKLGQYRDKSNKWRPTVHNHKERKYSQSADNPKRTNIGFQKITRTSYCHEYIGKG
tara:strand:- start:231 stop:1286 length:1056 start_codon:yes stop_codon:yes gene_type:complete